ncbi:hypothetical protein K458DRAFT_488806 [Lentithecium fluviatile CBS 122367]|uniref:Uncharacterized protein n=1 Tax=Lentithecium fluviatile CBS 122367 TaxID=1168545 RepID=A0A6G1IVT2_9PLEO|nr:hypothetical protein K458DRAFT_488806 [Lentithecium fluviatile CBS 122367]
MATQPNRPAEMKPIVGHRNRKARPSMVPAPVPITTPTAEESRRYLGLQPNTFTLAATVSSLQCQRSQSDRLSLWDGSTVRGVEPPERRRAPSPIQCHEGKGKGRADERPTNGQWKRPELTTETFVPPGEKPAALARIQRRPELGDGISKALSNGYPRLIDGINSTEDQTAIPRAPRLRPSPPPPDVKEEDLEQEHLLPSLRSAPLSSFSVASHFPGPTSPPLTSSPIPPSTTPGSITSEQARNFYTVPPRHTARPAAAVDQVRKYPLPNSGLRGETLTQNVDLQQNPALPPGRTFSSLDSYTETSHGSPVSTVESSAFEVGIYTSRPEGCMLRRADGKRYNMSSVLEEQRSKRILESNHTRQVKVSDGRDVSSAPGWMPQTPRLQPRTPEEEESPRQVGGSRILGVDYYRPEPRAESKRPEESLSSEQYLAWQRAALIEQGCNTFPRYGDSPATPAPVPLGVRNRIFPEGMWAAGPGSESKVQVPVSHVPETPRPDLDPEIAEWVRRSLVMAEQNAGPTQLTRRNAVRKPKAIQSSQVGEQEQEVEEHVGTEHAHTDRLFDSIEQNLTMFDVRRCCSSQHVASPPDPPAVTTHPPQAFEHEFAVELELPLTISRAETTSPSPTFYTALSFLLPPPPPPPVDQTTSPTPLCQQCYPEEDDVLLSPQPEATRLPLTAPISTPGPSQATHAEPEPEPEPEILNPISRRSSWNSNASRSSRFVEMMDEDGPRLYAAAQSQSQPQLQLQPEPLPLSLFTPSRPPAPESAPAPVDPESRRAVEPRRRRAPSPYPQAPATRLDEARNRIPLTGPGHTAPPPAQPGCLVKRTYQKLRTWKKENLHRDKTAKQQFPARRGTVARVKAKLGIKGRAPDGRKFYGPLGSG